MSPHLPKVVAQFVRYGLIGGFSPLITAGVIYLSLHFLEWHPYLCNIVGYISGVVNAFVFNSWWTFQSEMTWGCLGAFVVVFLICYGIQFLALLLLRNHTWIPPYPQQLVAMVVYTGCDFLFNKFVVFPKMTLSISCHLPWAVFFMPKGGDTPPTVIFGVRWQPL